MVMIIEINPILLRYPHSLLKKYWKRNYIHVDHKDCGLHICNIFSEEKCNESMKYGRGFVIIKNGKRRESITFYIQIFNDEYILSYVNGRQKIKKCDFEVLLVNSMISIWMLDVEKKDRSLKEKGLDRFIT